ncbi:MAG: tRNA 2-selenouridine synthase [Bacteroidota bacterium]
MKSNEALAFNPQDIFSQETVLIDVRSESEFRQGHIPGAVNVPVLNDEHRRQVGICYKEEGRDAAVRLGFRLAGPLFSDMIAKVDALSVVGEVYIYCWRGGMRSAFFGWILSAAGFRTRVIKGGYKNFRNWVPDMINKTPELLVIGGKTGTGKTNILRALSEEWPVIDLEYLASHRGSAFGHLGMEAQPSNEQFENLLAASLFSLRAYSCILVENESRLVGKIKIPDSFYNSMRAARVLKIEISKEERKQNILREYGVFSLEQLSESTRKLERKLGGLRLKNALQALNDGDKNVWLEIMLEYYDENYEWSQSQREADKTIIFEGSYDFCFESIRQFLKTEMNKKKE